MKSKILPFILSTFAITMLTVFPDRYISVSIESMKIFTLNVLPSLLPFMFFAQLLTNSGVGHKIGRLFYRPFSMLYNANSIGSYTFTMSVLSGYPIGAKIISDNYKLGLIDKREAKSIIAYSSTSGPTFVLGTVGFMMFNNKLYGVILLICHYISALLNGLLYRTRQKTPSRVVCVKNQNIWGDSAKGAVYGASVCGVYIIIFYIIAVMLDDIGVIGAIASVIRPIIGEVSDGLVFGLVEMTGGCIRLSSTTSIFTLPTACAIISFGGLSVALQSISFLSSCDLKAKDYLIPKLTQSLIAFALTYLACLLFCL